MFSVLLEWASNKKEHDEYHGFFKADEKVYKKGINVKVKSHQLSTSSMQQPDDNFYASSLHQAPVRGSASSAKYFPKHNIM